MTRGRNTMTLLATDWEDQVAPVQPLLTNYNVKQIAEALHYYSERVCMAGSQAKRDYAALACDFFLAMEGDER